MVSTRSSTLRKESTRRVVVPPTDIVITKKRKTNVKPKTSTKPKKVPKTTPTKAKSKPAKRTAIKKVPDVMEQNQAQESTGNDDATMPIHMISIPSYVVYSLNTSTMKHVSMNDECTDIKDEPEVSTDIAPSSSSLIDPMAQEQIQGNDGKKLIQPADEEILRSSPAKLEHDNLTLKLESSESPNVFNAKSLEVTTAEVLAIRCFSPASTLIKDEYLTDDEMVRCPSPASTITKEETQSDCSVNPMIRDERATPVSSITKDEYTSPARTTTRAECTTPLTSTMKDEYASPTRTIRKDELQEECPSPAMTVMKDELQEECTSPAITIIKDECTSPASTIVKDKWDEQCRSPAETNKRFDFKWSEMRFSVSPSPEKNSKESEANDFIEPDYGWEDPAPPKRKKSNTQSKSAIDDLDPSIREKMQMFNNKLQNTYDLDAIEASKRGLFAAIEESIAVQSQKKLDELDKQIQKKKDDYTFKLFGTNNFDSWNNDPALSNAVPSERNDSI